LPKNGWILFEIAPVQISPKTKTKRQTMQQNLKKISFGRQVQVI